MSADMLDLLQWPAMTVTIIATWLVASRRPGHRSYGFWLFLVSNALWVTWGWHDRAWALVALQVALALLNVRGAKKSEAEISER